MKRPCAALAMVKDEGVFMPFWLRHYGRFFEPQDLYVHSDGSTDDTETQCVSAGTNFYAIPPGTVAVGKNNVYVKRIISELLQSYECVLFAESPDDIIVPGPTHNNDLRAYLDDFIKSSDTYRFLTGVNVIQHQLEAPYDPARSLLSQRSHAVRCLQYDNPFLWKVEPLWGRGWHDLGGPRLEGMGDAQGEDKRLYNLHIHYADFELANRRHHVRLRTFNVQQRNAYMCRVDGDLRRMMDEMLAAPHAWFSNGKSFTIEPWMRCVI